MNASGLESGEVSKVYTRDSGHYTEYLVEIRIDKVEKGDDLKKRTYAYVHVSDRKANAPLQPSASGHAVPPKVGTPVRAWTMEIRGRLMGLYPNWFEKLPRKKKKSG